MSKKNVEWEWKKLGDVCDFNRGLTYAKKDEVEFSSNCILRSNNVDLETNALNLDELKYIRKDFDIPTSKYVKQGSLLICMSNGSKSHLGKVAYIDQDYNFAFGGFMGLLCPNNTVNGKFLHLMMCTPAYKEYIKSLSDGANINNLKYDDLKEFDIPIPPLDEQERIVKVLDDAFEKIDTIKTTAETNLQNAKDLFQTTLANELSITDEKIKQGWSNSTLKDSCTKIVDGTHHSPINTTKGDYQYITAKNIRKDGIDLSNITYVAKDIHEEIYARCNPIKGDVLLIKDGATTGIAVINNLDYEFSLLSSVALLKTDSKRLNAQFLVFILNSDNLQKQMHGKMDGAAITRLTLVKIKELQIPLPPLPIQKQIVAKLDSLSEKVKQLESNYKQVLTDCDELKKALLKQAFEGML